MGGCLKVVRNVAVGFGVGKNSLIVPVSAATNCLAQRMLVFFGKVFQNECVQIASVLNNFRACGRREMDCVRKFPVNFLTELLFGKGCFGLCFT